MIVFESINPNSYETIFGIVQIVYDESVGYHFDLHSTTIVEVPSKIRLVRFNTFGEAFNHLVKTEKKVLENVINLLLKTNKD